MIKDNTIEKRGFKRERGSGYPFINLEEAINIVKKARVFGKNLTDTQLAGEGSSKSGPFKQKKASLRYFNLISGREEDTHVTDLAEKIIYPKFGEEESAIQESFLSPSIYKSIYQNIQKQQNVNVEMLGNMIIRDYGVNAKFKSKFLRDFIKSGIFAKIIKYTDQSKNEIIFLEIESTKGNDILESTFLEPQKQENPEYRPKIEIMDQSLDYTTNEITVSTGVARLIVPKSIELTDNDIKRIHSYVDLLKP